MKRFKATVSSVIRQSKASNRRDSQAGPVPFVDSIGDHDRGTRQQLEYSVKATSRDIAALIVRMRGVATQLRGIAARGKLKTKSYHEFISSLQAIQNDWQDILDVRDC